MSFTYSGAHDLQRDCLHCLVVHLVRGSFSARMPKSSFARVRRVLVLHMEDGDDQENEKEDGREDGKQRVEGRVVENQATHNMSA